MHLNFQRPLLALGVLVGLGGMWLGTGTSHATFSICRTDPIVTLSNGAQVALYENITDLATDVTKITYTLHVPAGVTVTGVQYNGAIPASLQSLTVSADELTGNYDGYTEVYTKTASIAVTAYMSGTPKGATTSTVSAQTAGHSGQLLHSHLHF